MSDVPTSVILDRAADIMEGRKWAQAGDDPWGLKHPDGPICIEGGIMAAMGYEPNPNMTGTEYNSLVEEVVGCPAFMAVSEYLDLRNFDGERRRTIFGFNDAPGRTKDEVITALRGAAEQEREKENASE